MVRVEPTADASLAAIFARSRFGIAMAAMIKMIATTISNSISEKPFCFLFIVSPRSIAPKLFLLYSLAGYAVMYRKGDAKRGAGVYSRDTIAVCLIPTITYGHRNIRNTTML